MDRMTPEQRHKNMATIRSKDTSIEVKLRKALWHHGYRYRKNYTALPGSPDIAITKHRIAIFCDSEFFHGNSTYWIKKIVRNMQRDIENEQALRFQEWTVLRFWGQDIMKHTDECVKAVDEAVFEQIVETDSLLENDEVDTDDQRNGRSI